MKKLEVEIVESKNIKSLGYDMSGVDSKFNLIVLFTYFSPSCALGISFKGHI